MRLQFGPFGPLLCQRCGRWPSDAIAKIESRDELGKVVRWFALCATCLENKS